MIIVARHGRTAANARGLLLGRADPDLDDEGRLQASQMAAALAAAGRVTQVVSSPLQRCRQTASTVGDALGLPLTVDERWIELDYGDLDGVPVGEVPAETWAKWTADVTWAPPGGESLADLGERVRAACSDLARAGTGGAGRDDPDTLVVTHVSPVKAAVAWALGVGDEVSWRLYVAPASLTRIAATGGRRSLHSFNELAHR